MLFGNSSSPEFNSPAFDSQTAIYASVGAVVFVVVVATTIGIVYAVMRKRRFKKLLSAKSSDTHGSHGSTREFRSGTAMTNDQIELNVSYEK